jgi:hypothetical protein
VSWTRSRSALDMLASSGMVVIGEADGDAGGGVRGPAGVAAGVGVVVGVKVGPGVGVGVGVMAGVRVGSGVGLLVGFKVGSGVGAGVGTGLTERPQLSVKRPIRRRENARKQLVTFRAIVKNRFKTPCNLL